MFLNHLHRINLLKKNVQDWRGVLECFGGHVVENNENGLLLVYRATWQLFNLFGFPLIIHLSTSFRHGDNNIYSNVNVQAFISSPKIPCKIESRRGHGSLMGNVP
jgi:hypothetical protein